MNLVTVGGRGLSPTLFVRRVNVFLKPGESDDLKRDMVVHLFTRGGGSTWGCLQNLSQLLNSYLRKPMSIRL